MLTIKEGDEPMGAARILNMILADKRVTKTELAKRLGKPRPTLYNTFVKDNMQWDTVAEYADGLGCDIVIQDRETGKIYK